MKFKVFNIYPNFVIIDDTRLPRPFYMSVSQWFEWCNHARNDLTYEDGFEDGVESNEFTESDVNSAEDEGYEKAISDIRGDIRNFIDYHLECSSLDEKEASELSSKLWAIVT